MVEEHEVTLEVLSTKVTKTVTAEPEEDHVGQEAVGMVKTDITDKVIKEEDTMKNIRI